MDNITLIDITLRDGGLVNNFSFTDVFVRKLYQANLECGVNYMELGYRADKHQFNPRDYGKWKFTSDEELIRVFGEKDSSIKFSCMVDVGRCDYKHDILPKKDSLIDMFRIATYIDTIDEAISMINYISDLGYETTCNIMAISTASDNQITDALKKLSASKVLTVYIVDSFGALVPDDIRRLTALYAKYLKPAGKEVGIHTHNNMQCAFANAIEALNVGASWIDSSVCGMGRGAGNANLESLLCYLKDTYNPLPIFKIAEEEMPSIKAAYNWGYNTSYMLTGMANEHPRTAIAKTEHNDTDYIKQYKDLFHV